MRPWILVLFCVSLALSAGIVALALGRLELPLDDAFIPLRYALSAADGAPFRYFPGDPATAGATSLLWLGAATALALVAHGSTTALFGGVFVLEALVAVGTFLVAARLLRRLQVPAGAAVAAPFLLALTPPWFFGWFNGMETGLYGLSLLAAAWTLTGGSAWWLLLPALTRPEGAVLAALVLVVRAFTPRADARVPSRAALAGVAFTVAFGLAWPWLFTGAGATAWAAKALLAEPDLETRAFYTSRTGYFAWRALWFGLSGARPQPPLDLAAAVFRPDAWGAWVSCALFGGGAIAAAVRRRRPIVDVALLWAAASMTALATNAWDAQNYRYLIAPFPLLVVAGLAGWFAGGPARRVRLLPVAGTLLVLAALAANLAGPPNLRDRLVWLYRGTCERMRVEQVATGDWIRASLPADARVAAHDVGAIALIGDRPVVDLVGLVTPALAGAYRHGEGALWEALSDLPVDRRPTDAAVVPAWMPYLTRTLWFAEALYPSTDARRNPPGRAFEVWRLSWPDADPETWPGGDFGDEPAIPGFADGILDAVDVADIASERAHAFTADVVPTPAPGEKPTLVRDLGFDARVGAPPRAHAMEGGRLIDGAATFTFRTPPDGDALLVLRAVASRPVTLTVRAWNWETTLEIPAGETTYVETAVAVPSSALAASPRDETGMALPTLTVEGGPYTAFHWWLVALPD